MTPQDETNMLLNVAVSCLNESINSYETEAILDLPLFEDRNLVSEDATGRIYLNAGNINE